MFISHFSKRDWFYIYRILYKNYIKPEVLEKQKNRYFIIESLISLGYMVASLLFFFRLLKQDFVGLVLPVLMFIVFFYIYDLACLFPTFSFSPKKCLCVYHPSSETTDHSFPLLSPPKNYDVLLNDNCYFILYLRLSETDAHFIAIRKNENAENLADFVPFLQPYCEKYIDLTRKTR